jgi:glycosyltransferase involved in cell wall biosynthesis
LKKLPEIFTSFDINIAPLEKKILNNIKNENAWVLASLMKVPTIASNYGIFKHVIKNNKTGLLCSKENDWYLSLKTLINNEQYRKNLGENAYKYCEIEYNTLYNGYKLGHFINLISNKHIGFYIPSLEIYGGIYVILKHALILKSIGWNVDLIIEEGNIELFEFQGQQFNVISLKNSFINSQYDIIVATYFTTLYSILNYYKTKRYLYLVQGYETNFFQYGNIFRIMAEKTYSTSFDIEYITISTWCKNWLWEKYKKKAKYSPNGIDFNNFTFYKRNLKKKKIRILIEGDSYSYYKNVDESFKITEKLDKNNFEIWYLSSSGKPKNWYKFDKFYNKIPFDQVKKIYYDCDILIKSSWLESFSYPPLEMIATGGYCIVVPNEGNKEYLRNEENCLFYNLGDIESAVKSINRLINDDKLQEILFTNGLLTARKRDWKNYINQVIQLYENQ